MTNGSSRPELHNPALPTSVISTGRESVDAIVRRNAGHITALLHASIIAEVTEPQTISRDVLASVLDTLATPVLLVDRNFIMLQSNAAARAVLASGGPISADGRTIKIASAAGPTLANALRAAANGCPLRRSLIVEAPGMPAVAVWLRPVDQRLQSAAPQWHNGIVSLTLRSLGRAAAVPTTVLRSHYGLSRRQVQLVVHLAGGASLDDAAEAMAIGMPTARSHLARCFEKTGTHRQSELIGLALSLAPPVLE